MTIRFYSKTTAYHELSNFAPYGIEMDQKWYPTIEHHFQAMKFADPSHTEKIRKAHTPASAKTLRRSRKLPIREDWDSARVDIMREAIRQKFKTHDSIRHLLLETGDEELIEAAPRDYFWGCGSTGTGKNMLGQILMDVRQELRDNR